jgi:hypothetical protein
MALKRQLEDSTHADYSTVSQEEMNQAVAAVIDLAATGKRWRDERRRVRLS